MNALSASQKLLPKPSLFDMI